MKGVKTTLKMCNFGRKEVCIKFRLRKVAAKDTSTTRKKPNTLYQVNRKGESNSCKGLISFERLL
jgi:hypothetical protein